MNFQVQNKQTRRITEMQEMNRGMRQSTTFIKTIYSSDYINYCCLANSASTLRQI